MVHLRAARPLECPELSHLALRSKAFWGYDPGFIEACRAELTIEPCDIERLRVVVAERGGRVAGFYALEGRPPDAELALLFVAPECMGVGVGRALWSHCVRVAAELGVVTIRIESDPFAEPFYLAMGAVRVGLTPSRSIPDRSLPLLRVEVSAEV